MIQLIREWFNYYFSDREAVLLLFLLLGGVLLVMGLGDLLAPVFASIVIVYLLEGWVSLFRRCNIPRLPAVLLVYVGFLSLFSLLFFVLIPLLLNQLTNLFDDLPTMITRIKTELAALKHRFPGYLSETQVEAFFASVLQDMRGWGKVVLSASIASIPNVITWFIYIILVPLLVFFFLKDRRVITRWCLGFLPKERPLLHHVWREVNEQIGNYVQGKVAEIIILGLVTYLVFWYFGLRYSVLLASLVGLSALIPYIGGVVVTLPVVFVAYLQWGYAPVTGYLLLTYLIVQILDGNLLVPLLFSEAVNLHPIAIIVATLVFGGIWGFWGVFFAIPLATVVKAVLYAWPKGPYTKKITKQTISSTL